MKMIQTKEKVPFPMRFAEKMKTQGVVGDYDSVKQILKLSHAFAGTSIFTETQTGGHGDTDQNEDPD